MSGYKLFVRALSVALLATIVASLLIVSQPAPSSQIPSTSQDAISITGFASLPAPPGAPSFEPEQEPTPAEMPTCQDPGVSFSLATGESNNTAITNIFSGNTENITFTSSTHSGLTISVNNISLSITNSDRQTNANVSVQASNSAESIACSVQVVVPEPEPVTGVETAEAVQRTITVGSFSDWQQIPSVAYDGQGSDAIPQGWGSSFKAAWDQENFYFFVNVEKDTPLANNQSAFWENDNVELFIGGNNSKSDPYTDSDHQLQLRYDGELKMGINATMNPPEISFETQTTADGYQLEVAIPWSYIGGQSPVLGQVYGFTTSTIYYINDTTSQVAWWRVADNHPRSTLEWSEMELIGPIDVPEEEDEPAQEEEEDSQDGSSGSSGSSGGSSSGGGGGGGSSGGGGGGGFASVPSSSQEEEQEDTCNVSFQCEPWSACSVDGQQQRICVDVNGCQEAKTINRTCEAPFFVTAVDNETVNESVRITRDDGVYTIQGSFSQGTMFYSDEYLGLEREVFMDGQQYWLVQTGNTPGEYKLYEGNRRPIQEPSAIRIDENTSSTAIWPWVLLILVLVSGGSLVGYKVVTQQTTESVEPKQLGVDEWLKQNVHASDENLIQALVTQGWDVQEAKNRVEYLRAKTNS